MARRVDDGYWGSGALELSIAGTADKITVSSFFLWDELGGDYSPLQEVRFADGTVWNIDAIKARLFSGTSGDDNLRGTGAGDSIAGGLGNDTIDGAAGNDTIDGGAGNDTLYGETGADTLVGGDGNDTLDGGTEGDSMSGGVGDDIYLVDNAGDVVIESPSEGYDVVRSRVSMTLPTNVEQLQLEGYDNIDATGNDDANAIFGNEAINHIVGLAGDDELRGGGSADLIEGGSGDDLLDGGSDADTLAGGLGDDTYLVDQSDDVVQESFNEGIDTVLASASYVLSANVEHLVLEEQGWS